MHLNGVVLDIYDDPTASVLRQKLAGRSLPEALGNSNLLTQEKLAALPDRLFGLVATNGDAVVRKFAMHDPAHTTTSVLYFLETHHLLPEPAQKIAAQNLLIGCKEYGIQAPALLEKIAFLGTALSGGATLLGHATTGMSAAALPGQVLGAGPAAIGAARDTMAGFRKAQMGG